MSKESGRKDEWWNELPKSVQKSILKAEKQLKAGKGIPHEIVMKKYNQWLTNNVVTQYR